MLLVSAVLFSRQRMLFLVFLSRNLCVWHLAINEAVYAGSSIQRLRISLYESGYFAHKL